MNGRKWMARILMARLFVCLVVLMVVESARIARAHSKRRAKSCTTSVHHGSFRGGRGRRGH